MSNFGCADIGADCVAALDPCAVSRDEFICQALKLLPRDQLYNRPGCSFHEFFCAVASTYYDQWRRACDALLEFSPCTAVETLGDWAGIWSDTCGGLPTDTQELQDTLCALVKYRGVLTCEFITEIVTAAGYTVLDCGMDLETTGETVNPVCGWSLGWSRLGPPNQPRVDACKDKYMGQPCATNCCEGEAFEEMPIMVDPCEIVTNGAYCANVTCDDLTACGVGLGNFPNGAPYEPLVNPGVICVTIDKDSPAIDICDLPNGLVPNSGALGVGSSCVEIDADVCAVEAIKPAHLEIRYKVNC